MNSFKFTLLTIVFMTTTMSSFSQDLSCFCTPKLETKKDFKDDWHGSDYVLEIKIKDRELGSISDGNYLIFIAEVISVYKGNQITKRKPIKIKSPKNLLGECFTDFEVEEVYIFYGHKRNGHFAEKPCSRTKLKTSSTFELEQINKLKE
jgi:hypothetical protein